MKVTVIQPDIVWANPLANIHHVEGLIAIAPSDSDLYVLPEMWATGFATEPENIAEDEESSVSLAWMKSFAESRHCAICGSLAIRTTKGDYRNRHYFIDGRNHSLQYYDKHHLFTYGGENRYYKAGDCHKVITYNGFRILLLTCYDLRFPVWSRYSTNIQYDMIICVANWPESRQNTFQILTRARAMENMAYLIACNRIGNDQYSHYRGCSCMISPIGKTIKQCCPNKPDIITHVFDIESLKNKRAKFRVLEDVDPFTPTK